MNGNIFINNALTNSITKYIENMSKPDGVEFNSFGVIVIRLLSIIYGQLDIKNPYTIGNEELFVTNLCKYDFPKERVINFLNNLELFEKTNNKELFISIQKDLIDMLEFKRKAVEINDTEKNQFRSLLYSSENSNMLQLSLNYKLANNSNEVIDYFDNKIRTVIPDKKEEKRVEMLSQDAYELFNFKIDELKQLKNAELETINKKVYNYFGINENAINKNYLLDKAVNDFYKPKYGFTGNGYVNILFFMSIVACSVLVIIIFTLLIK